MPREPRHGGRVAGLDHLFLPVGEFGDAWRFWTEVVGLAPGATWGEGDHRAGTAALGPSHVVVSGEPPGFDGELGSTSRVGVPALFLRAEGLDALCEGMRARGARILREPFATHWGPRCFTVEGPDGMVVGFVEDSHPEPDGPFPRPRRRAGPWRRLLAPRQGRRIPGANLRS